LFLKVKLHPDAFCKWGVTVFFALLVGITSSSSIYQTPVTGSLSDFLIYNNPDLGISIQYPINWEKVENGDTVRFSSQYENNLDTLRESFVIDVQFLPFQNIFTSEEFVYDPEEGFIERSKRELTNFHLVNSIPITVSNMPAYKVIFTETQMIGGVPHNYQEMYVFILKNDLVYVLEYFAEPNTFNYYLPTIDRMISSFQITS
jgi:eukaryotic-like serine/threonine-protein kinase